MDTFEPITIKEVISAEVGKPKNDYTPGAGLYSVPIRLSRRAPADWAKLFVTAWDHPRRFTSSHRPGICEVYGDRVTLTRTTLEEVDATHKATLLLALEEANTKYAEMVTKQDADTLRQKQADDAHRAHVADMADKIKFD